MHTSSQCPECGAPVGPGASSCRENFEALLALEWEIPGGPGEVAHFFAVATYGIQHPGSMGYTANTVEGLVGAVRSVLAGTTTMEDVRRNVRKAATAAGRITRRGDEPIPHHPVGEWPINVTDVLAGGTAEYAERVSDWAASVIDVLDAL